MVSIKRKTFKDIIPGDCIELEGLRFVVLSSDVDTMYPEIRLVRIQRYSSYVSGEPLTEDNYRLINPNEDYEAWFVCHL